MEEYNIKDIELEEKEKSKEIPKLLTGEVITELPENSPVPANSETEKNEWLQFPDGTTQKIDGKTHEQDGVKMNIPDGTKIVSNSLKINKTQARTIKAQYDIDVTTSDTYATAIDKYTRKIGLKKLNDEQEDVFEELKRTLEKTTDRNTFKVNQDYLAKKIYDIEQNKQPKEKERANFFNVVFDMQEATKPQKKEGETMKYGGMSKSQFESVCKEHGISHEHGLAMMNDGGEYQEEGLPMYDWGGVAGTEGDKLKKQWNSDEKAYLAYKAKEDALLSPANEEFVTELFNEYLKVAEDEKNYTSGATGKAGWKKALLTYTDEKTKVERPRTKEEVVNALLAQEKRNARLKAFGLVASETGQKAVKGKGTNQKTLDLINRDAETKEVFSDIDFSRGYQGQAAYKAYNNLITSDKYKNNYTAEKIGESDEGVDKKSNVSGIDNDSTDTTLGEFISYIPNIETVKTQEEVNLEEPIKDTKTKVVARNPDGTVIVDKTITPVKAPLSRLWSPDMYPLPPSPLEANLKTDINLQRLDPTRVGIENVVQTASDNDRFFTEQISSLPDSQRASLLASTQGARQDTINKAIMTANIANAQDQKETELFNIGQTEKEQMYEANSALNYEERQMKGKSNYEESVRNFYDRIAAQNLNQFQNQQALGTLESTYPNARYNADGSISYAEATPWEIQQGVDRENYLRWQQMQNSKYLDDQEEEESKKKKEKEGIAIKT